MRTNKWIEPSENHSPVFGALYRAFAMHLTRIMCDGASRFDNQIRLLGHVGAGAAGNRPKWIYATANIATIVESIDDTINVTEMNGICQQSSLVSNKNTKYI